MVNSWKNDPVFEGSQRRIIIITIIIIERPFPWVQMRYLQSSLPVCVYLGSLLMALPLSSVYVSGCIFSQGPLVTVVR